MQIRLKNLLHVRSIASYHSFNHFKSLMRGGEIRKANQILLHYVKQFVNRTKLVQNL